MSLQDVTQTPVGLQHVWSSHGNDSDGGLLALVLRAGEVHGTEQIRSRPGREDREWLPEGTVRSHQIGELITQIHTCKPIVPTRCLVSNPDIFPICVMQSSFSACAQHTTTPNEKNVWLPDHRVM